MLQTVPYNILARRLPQLTARHSPVRRNITNISHIMGKKSYGYIPRSEIAKEDTEQLDDLLHGTLRTQLLKHRKEIKKIRELLSPIISKLEEKNPELIFSIGGIRNNSENNSLLHVDKLSSDVKGQGLLLLNTGDSTLYFEGSSDIFQSGWDMRTINHRFIKEGNKEKFMSAAQKAYTEMKSKNSIGSAFLFSEKESSKGLVHCAPFDVNKPEYLEQIASHGGTFAPFGDRSSRFVVLFDFRPNSELLLAE